MKRVKKFTRHVGMEPKVFVGSLAVEITCYLRGRRAARLTTTERGLLMWAKKALELVQTLSVLILALVLVGCGRYEADPAFTPYVDAFRAVMVKQNVADYAQRWSVTLKFGDPTIANLGECDRGDVQGEVIIDKALWNTLVDDEKKLIIFHELGHCVLGRKHIQTFHTDENNVFTPDSIMYPDARSVVTAYRLAPESYEAELVAGFPKQGGAM